MPRYRKRAKRGGNAVEEDGRVLTSVNDTEHVKYVFEPGMNLGSPGSEPRGESWLEDQFDRLKWTANIHLRKQRINIVNEWSGAMNIITMTALLMPEQTERGGMARKPFLKQRDEQRIFVCWDDTPMPCVDDQSCKYRLEQRYHHCMRRRKWSDGQGGPLPIENGRTPAVVVVTTKPADLVPNKREGVSLLDDGCNRGLAHQVSVNQCVPERVIIPQECSPVEHLCSLEVAAQNDYSEVDVPCMLQVSTIHLGQCISSEKPSAAA
jgi:hypothetical protein